MTWVPGRAASHQAKRTGLKMLRQPLLAAFLAASATAALGTARQLPEADRQRPATMPTPPEVEQFVEQALRDRLAAGDIPDLGVASQDAGKVLYVRADMPGSRMKLTPAALPQLPGMGLKLIGLVDAEEQVARTGERIAFLTVDRVQIEGLVATVWLGADYIAPAQHGIIKLCCCESEARFEKQDGRWKFTRWGLSRCR